MDNQDETPAEEHGEKSGKVEFKAPADFHIPEGNDGGKTFDVVCTFEAKDDGNICLTRIGEVDAPGYGKNKAPDDKAEAKPSYAGMGQNMATAMSDYSSGQGA